MASSPPLLQARSLSLFFSESPLFTDVTCAISQGDRVALVGHNGSGKTTLLKLLQGELSPDKGTLFRQPGLSIGYLAQEPIFTPGLTIKETICEGLPPHMEDATYLADSLLSDLGINGDAPNGPLSGGEHRRTALAQALISAPDILFLDEPTNHLDIQTIEWLEVYLRQMKTALVLISHDRTFLSQTTNRIFWLEGGQLYSHNKGFSAFTGWQEDVFASWTKTAQKMDKRLAQEDRWLLRGVTARRKRNQGRLRKLTELREARSHVMQERQLGKLGASGAQNSGKLVADLENVSFAYGDRIIINNFTTRIQKGDKIGIVGANGSGKTTFLKLITGQLSPTEGRLKVGTKQEVVYFDQSKSQLDPEKSLQETLCPGGGDQVIFQDKPQHVVGYLRRFFFPREQVNALVKTLSGGEKNRLLLAKLLAQPSNIMILDEPTNDLDMDTLDLLADLLLDYAGTLIVVSHDRDFLDNIVGSVILMDGQGTVTEYLGGFQDAFKAHEKTMPGHERLDNKASQLSTGGNGTPLKRQKQSKPRLSFKQTFALEKNPILIQDIEKDIKAIDVALSDTRLFSTQPEKFQDYIEKRSGLLNDKSSLEEALLEAMMASESLASNTDER